MERLKEIITNPRLLIMAAGVVLVGIALTTTSFRSPKSPFDQLTLQMESSLKKGNLDAALAQSKSRLEVAKKSFDGGAPQVADAYHDVGGILLQSGKYDEARSFLEKSVALEIQIRGIASLGLPEKLISLAEVHQAQGESSKAEAMVVKAISILDVEAPDKRNRDRVRGYAVKAQAALEQQACDRAMDAAQHGLSFSKEVNKERGLQFTLQAVAGRAAFCLNDHAEAEEYIRDAIQLAKKQKNDYDEELPKLIALNGELLCKMGKCKQGTKLKHDAYKLARKTFGENHPDTVALQINDERLERGDSSRAAIKRSAVAELDEEPMKDSEHFSNF